MPRQKVTSEVLFAQSVAEVIDGIILDLHQT